MKLTAATAVLPAEDLDRVVAFYSEKVGLPVTRGIVDEGGHHREDHGATIGENGNRLYVYPVGSLPSGGFTQAGPQVSDVRATVMELRARGVTFEEYDIPTIKTTDGIAPTADGREAAWFKDSEGNILVLVESDG